MLSVRLQFPKSDKNKVTTMFATDETVDLAQWIIDDTCLVLDCREK